MQNYQINNKGPVIIKFTVIFFAIIGGISAQRNSTCPQTCQFCSSNSSFCNACSDGYELSHLGQCIASSTVQNCQLFGLRQTCLACKPTFRLLLNNSCIKMSDGCLISGPSGVCSKCLEGAIRNQFGQCQIKYLNCLKISQNRQCILCQRGYRLEDGKCKNNDENCQFYEPASGLCMLCKKGFKLLQYRCIKQDDGQNCYIIAQNFLTCSYCKPGFQSYYGKCYTAQKIDILIYQGNITKKCTPTQYFDLRSQLCYPQPQYCEKFDYGFLRCVSCWSTFVVIGGLCRDPSLRFCQKFDINPYACKICSPKFFLTSNFYCREFPKFCQQVSNQKCVKCIDLFLLNSKGTCEDPNCQIFDNSLSQCIKCKTSYFKDKSTSICTFEDANCLETGPNQICKRCKTDYAYDISKKMCKFVDPNCKIFSQKQICLECRTGYYINDKNNVCMQLPYKCLNADSQGRCKYCAQGYALLTTRECSQIINISNCLASSSSNSNICRACKQGFYLDQKGICLELPVLCQQFDSIKRFCLKCNQNSQNRRGVCYDNFCQIFGEQSQCLGCKPGYQFNKKGECVIEKTDSNCKQFLNGQCRVCSDRYYFNSQWKCVSVSTLCRNYDPNNGQCSSCYPGYALQDGECIRQLQRLVCQTFSDANRTRCKKCKPNYRLNDKDGQCYLSDRGCIQRSVSNRTCLKCAQSYLLDQQLGYCLKTTLNSSNINNSTFEQKREYVDANCIELNANRTQCLNCVTRMFYSRDPKVSKCVAIDPNCRDYEKSTGECTICYEGYVVTANKLGCQLTKPKDINCKLFQQQGEQCKECYNGFYFSPTKGYCVQIDSLCKTADSANGKCLSCWGGYSLVYGRCVVNNQTTPISSNSFLAFPAVTQSNNKTNPPTQNTNKPIDATVNQGCQVFDEGNRRCRKCIRELVYDQQTKSCESPTFGVDQNCGQYRLRACTKCKDLYRLRNNKCIII